MNLELTSKLDGVSRYLRGEQLRVQFSLPAYVLVVHLQLPNAVSLSEQFVRPEMCPNFGGSQEVFTSSRECCISFLHIKHLDGQILRHILVALPRISVLTGIKINASC